MEKRLIWDIPTRLFHWLLVASIFGLYATAEWMDDAVQWHFYLGYFTLGLIIFRVIWGFVGPTYARFSHFVKGPGAVFSYMKTLGRKDSAPATGHNALGGYAVIIMLIMIGLQAVSGLFMTDDIYLDGPYRHLVDESVLDVMNTLHHRVFDVLLWVIGFHIAAIVFYAVFKKQKLVPPMIHGKKQTQGSGIPSSKLLLALVIALIVGFGLYYAIEIAPPAPAVEEFYY